VNRVVVVVGATGTGKSELALDLAERLRAAGDAAEIVNADAMQLYRGMDIGTAKLTVDERRSIPHHLLDVLDPREEANVARYQGEARAVIDTILAGGATPILVGGSGLYVSSVVDDFRFPGTDDAIRARLEAELVELGPGILFERLRGQDAAAAAAIGPHNSRRIVRALEVIELTGEPFGSGLPRGESWRPTVTVGLHLERARLVPRLDARVERMWRNGMVDEVARLRPAGFGATAARAIGYAQALRQLEGELDAAAAVAETQLLTRRYARRQVSWFRRSADTRWIDADDPGRLAAAVEAISTP